MIIKIKNKFLAHVNSECDLSYRVEIHKKKKEYNRICLVTTKQNQYTPNWVAPNYDKHRLYQIIMVFKSFWLHYVYLTVGISSTHWCRSLFLCLD